MKKKNFFKLITETSKHIFSEIKIISQRHVFANQLNDPLEHELYGQEGEDIIYDLLLNKVDYIKRNPILKEGKYYLEKDFIVIDRGNIFVIEVKNWVGRIYCKKDSSVWIKEKEDPYTFQTHIKQEKSPFLKTKKYCEKLRKLYQDSDYLNNHLSFYPVVVFIGDECNIDSSIKQIDAGILYDNELLKYIKSKKKAFIEDEKISFLKSIRTWDVVVKKNDVSKYGIIEDSIITFEDEEKKQVYIQTQDIVLFNKIETHLRYDSFEIFMKDHRKIIVINKNESILFFVPGSDSDYERIDLSKIKRFQSGSY